MFGQHLVQTRAIPAEFRRVLNDANDDQELADYHTLMGSSDVANVGKLVSIVRRFVEQVEKMF